MLLKVVKIINSICVLFKGCDSNFEVKCSNFKNETYIYFKIRIATFNNKRPIYL